MCVLGCCDSIPPNVFLQLTVVFSMVLRQHGFSKRIETVCVCLWGCCDSMPQSFFLSCCDSVLCQNALRLSACVCFGLL